MFFYVAFTISGTKMYYCVTHKTDDAISRLEQPDYDRN